MKSTPKRVRSWSNQNICRVHSMMYFHYRIVQENAQESHKKLSVEIFLVLGAEKLLDKPHDLDIIVPAFTDPDHR